MDRLPTTDGPVLLRLAGVVHRVIVGWACILGMAAVSIACAVRERHQSGGDA